jgi:translation initiation factor 3 subunit G
VPLLPPLKYCLKLKLDNTIRRLQRVPKPQLRMSAKVRWGDVDDDDDMGDVYETNASAGNVGGTASSGGGTSLVIPPTITSRVDSHGIKLVTSYRANPANATSLIKTTTKIRVSNDWLREHVDVEKRRHWKKFGTAAHEEDQSNVTIQSKEDIFMEDPHADVDIQDLDPTKALSGNLNAFWVKQQQRQLERKYDVEGLSAAAAASANATGTAEENRESGGGGDGGWQRVGADGKASSAGGGGAATDKYVPPGQRGGPFSSTAGLKGAGGLAGLASRSGNPGDINRDQNTLRVTNISEETTEAELQQLFQVFGRISRVYLAKDKETMQSRGFAFVSFVHREEAAIAMEKLQGYGLNHLILKLEWARPSAAKEPGSESTVFRSGYGKALAQDTKEKVSFASNLTK